MYGTLDNKTTCKQIGLKLYEEQVFGTGTGKGILDLFQTLFIEKYTDRMKIFV